MQKVLDIYEKEFTWLDGTTGSVKTGKVGVSIDFKEKKFWLWPADKKNSTSFDFICVSNPENMVSKWSAMFKAMRECVIFANSVLNNKQKEMPEVKTSFKEEFDEKEILKKFYKEYPEIKESHKIAYLGVDSL
jgi:activator of 2-hydroxyglutaryl-CoA dehydratase